ncbi:MAG: sigma-70 family RNA polymerase sigma factor [Candidatus Brocadiae bacterium]|nr:sigma-70 family RNA polymerase sigma factor [Candidatus Brocadiia bacterium]
MSKCTHGDNWSLCFLSAQQNQKFLDECLSNIQESMIRYFEKHTNREEAKDKCQDLLLILCQCFKNFRETGNHGKAYVYRIAQNILVKHKIQEKRQRMQEKGRIEEDLSLNAESKGKKEIIEVVEHCISDLPAKYENIITLRSIQRLKAEEVARTIQIPIRTQHNYYKIGIELLKKCFEKQGLYRR